MERAPVTKIENNDSTESSVTEGEALNNTHHEAVPETENSAEELHEPVEQEEIEKELESLPQEEREKIGLGLHNIGYKIEEIKDRVFAKGYSAVSNLFDSQSTTGRFFSALEKQFTDKEEQARNTIQSIEEKRTQEGSAGIMAHLGNAGSLSGNLLRYGRVATDAAGWTASSVTRSAMLGSMVAASGAEAAKEARLKNEEVIDQTRIQDIEKAADEAWAIHQSAEERKASGETVSKEDLQKIYEERIPKDILGRLAQNPQSQTGSKILQSLFQKHVTWSVSRLNNKFVDIDSNESLTQAQKEAGKEKILNGWFGSGANRKMLNDYDRLLTQQGTVDALGMSARYAEKGAKAVMYAMMADSVYKLWDGVSDMLSGNSENVAGVTAENAAQPTATEAVPLPVDLSNDYEIITYGESVLAEERPDPLGPRDGSPIIKTFISDNELNNYTASPETTEKMESFLAGESNEPVAGLDDHSKELLQKEIEELDAAIPTSEPAVSYSSEATGTHAESMLQKESNLLALSQEINQTPEYIVRPGDNVWNIIERKLEAHDIFRGMEEGQRTYIIDELKDKVAAMSPDELREFGIGSGNPNLIKAGEHLDFSKIMGDDSVENAVTHADNLSTSQIEQIEKYTPIQMDAVSNANNISPVATEDYPTINPSSEQAQMLNEQMDGAPSNEMSAAQTAVFKAEDIIKEDLHTMYGSEGIFGSGLLGTEGSESLDWTDLKDRPVTELLAKQEFPTEDLWGDDINTDYGFDSESVVQKMQEYISKLSKESGLKPNWGETVTEFIHRATEKVVLKS